MSEYHTSGLYARLRDCAALVDEVLVALKCGGGVASPRQAELATLLLRLADAESGDLSERLIGLHLRHKCADQVAAWRRAGEALRSSAGDAATIESLEQLANCLESERASAVAQARGGTR